MENTESNKKGPVSTKINLSEELEKFHGNYSDALRAEGGGRYSSFLLPSLYTPSTSTTLT